MKASKDDTEPPARGTPTVAVDQSPRVESPAYWLFDLDDTLVYVRAEYIHDVLGTVGDRIGYRFTRRQTELIWRGHAGPPDCLLNRWGIDPDRFWTAYHAVEEPADRIAATNRFPDARILAELTAPVGIVTHCQPPIAEGVLDRLDLASFVDSVICCNDTTGWKPDPGPIRVAQAQLGVAPDDPGILVGDSPQDIGAARNTGLMGILVQREAPISSTDELRADARLSSLEMLAAQRRGQAAPATTETRNADEHGEDPSPDW